MTNSEKIQILKDNVANIIRNLMRVDEQYLFNFAKQQAKEMQIEITKGEIKSMICNILANNQYENSNINNEFIQQTNNFDIINQTTENYMFFH